MPRELLLLRYRIYEATTGGYLSFEAFPLPLQAWQESEAAGRATDGLFSPAADWEQSLLGARAWQCSVCQAPAELSERGNSIREATVENDLPSPSAEGIVLVERYPTCGAEACKHAAAREAKARIDTVFAEEAFVLPEVRLAIRPALGQPLHQIDQSRGFFLDVPAREITVERLVEGLGAETHRWSRRAIVEAGDKCAACGAKCKGFATEIKPLVPGEALVIVPVLVTAVPTCGAKDCVERIDAVGFNDD
ncbi:hypothetical protein DFJ74DRAFT_764205 [Hyaloraphidium curvatum]|nr:hypothetical protein DFJ74DRAFT_764205 [Hyaloraphidium curvatum]